MDMIKIAKEMEKISKTIKSSKQINLFDECEVTLTDAGVNLVKRTKIADDKLYLEGKELKASLWVLFKIFGASITKERYFERNTFWVE